MESIVERIDARKEKIDPEKAWKLLCTATRIEVAKGKKRLIFQPSDSAKPDILAQVIGPSGYLRAPVFRLGSVFIVGFHPEIYQENFG